MRIANALYDHAFKFLMSNNRLAKKVISTILDTPIVKLELNQQEFVSEGKVRGTRVFRLDFKVTIQQADGMKQQVMIELQKSKLPTNIYRFRQYLGSLYADKSKPEDIDFEDQKAPETLPIIAIYILGYNIPDLPFLATRITRGIIDAVSDEEIVSGSEFIQALSHESYILQVSRLSDNRRTRLERFLNLFNQAYVSDKNYILDLDDIRTEFEDVAEYLQKPLKMEEMVEQFTVEEEMEMYFRIVEAEKKKLATELEELHRKKEELSKEKEELSKEKKVLFEEKEVLSRDKEALFEEKQVLFEEKEKLTEK
jgi:hypothetical protein